MTSTAQKIAYNTIISIIARIASMILALIIIALATRYLGEALFGEYIIILAYLYVFSVLADLGLYSIVVREISKEGADEKRIINNAFTLRFIGGIFIFIVGIFIALFFPYTFETKLGIAIGAIGFWFLGNSQVLMGVFQKYLRMDKVAIAEIIGRLAQFAFVVLVIWQDWGFLAIVFALTLGGLVNFLFVFLFVRRYVRLSFIFDFNFWKKLLKESYPLALSAILVMIYFKMDTIFLSVMKPTSDVGIYGVGYKILESLIFFPAMFIGLVMPHLSRWAHLDKEKFKKISQKALDFLLVLIVPLIVGTLFLAEKIIVLVAGKDFPESTDVLNILVFAVGVIFLGALFSNMMIARNMQKQLAKIYGLGAAFNFGANLVFIPRYSYIGASLTTVATEILVTVLMIFVLYKSLEFFLSFKITLKAIFASAVMGCFLYFLRDYNLFILLGIAVLSYFGTLLVIGGISKEDIEMLVGRKI